MKRMLFRMSSAIRAAHAQWCTPEVKATANRIVFWVRWAMTGKKAIVWYLQHQEEIRQILENLTNQL